MRQKVIVLATGGTIAGMAQAGQVGYTAAQLSIAQLLQAVPGSEQALQGCELEAEQIAQIDSKDMDFATLTELALACERHLQRSDVRGLIITHGTDTVEETAYFLHRVLPAQLQTKPVVLTCAMRPANSPQADGPGNLRDAMRVATDAQARGVLLVCAEQVHDPVAVQKVHTQAVDAFSSGGEPWARVHEAAVHWKPGFFNQKEQKPLLAAEFIAQFAIKSIATPRVEIVFNHVGASGAVVQALLNDRSPTQPLRGIVVAGTGNGTMSEALQVALQHAQLQGVAVLRASRCAWGGVQAWGADDLACSELSAVKARIELILDLMRA